MRSWIEILILEINFDLRGCDGQTNKQTEGTDPRLICECNRTKISILLLLIKFMWGQLHCKTVKGSGRDKLKGTERNQLSIGARKRTLKGKTEKMEAGWEAEGRKQVMG